MLLLVPGWENCFISPIRTEQPSGDWTFDSGPSSLARWDEDGHETYGGLARLALIHHICLRQEPVQGEAVQDSVCRWQRFMLVLYSVVGLASSQKGLQAPFSHLDLDYFEFAILYGGFLK